MLAHSFHLNRPFARAFSSLVIILILVIGFSVAAYGANPAEEMAKVGTTDPKGDSWQAIQHSLEQFAHPEFILRLFLSLSLAVVCAYEHYTAALGEMKAGEEYEIVVKRGNETLTLKIVPAPARRQ